MDCAVILGAGFSHVAGLPLAGQMFDVKPFVTSEGALRRFDEVLLAWDKWQESHPDKGPEQFLEHLWHSLTEGFLWAYAVELLGAALATPQSDARMSLRYGQTILRPAWCSAHQRFWDRVLRTFSVRGVVTTNYDVLIERGLRHKRMQRPPRPGIHYGGIPHPQLLHGLAAPWTVEKPQREVQLQGSVPLYKLHGSLNWSKEGSCLKMYLDLRPAFRHGGDAAIVPPMPEKEVPPWLKPVWRDAEACLAQSPVWLVCGYSMPRYDHTVREMLARSARAGQLSKLIIMDPASTALASEWTTITACNDVHATAGLPEGLDYLPGQLW